jgi:alcohol dehydrogenase
MITSRLGARSVIVVDPLDYRLEKSKEFGSTHRINPDRENVEEAAAAVTGGMGPDVVVEAAGYPEAFNQCLRVAPAFGTIIVFGLMSEHNVTVEHELIVYKQLRIIGTNSARLADATAHIKEIVALRQRGWCDPGALVTHRLGFSQVQNAYEMYEQQQDEIIKVVLNLNE